MLVFLVLVVVPVIFCMVSWVLFTASRLFTIEDSRGVEQRAYSLRKRSRIEGSPVPVRSSTVGDSRYIMVLSALNAYRLHDDRSSGIPNLWHDDIWLRRN
jgi:hypothetical protein